MILIKFVHFIPLDMINEQFPSTLRQTVMKITQFVSVRQHSLILLQNTCYLAIRKAVNLIFNDTVSVLSTIMSNQSSEQKLHTYV